MFVAPTEPPQIKVLGKSSSLPEAWGSDLMWPAKGGMAGVQRKEFSDLIASLRDGRLAKELAQMQQLAWRLLIVEGKPKWTMSGELLDGYTNFTKKQLRGVLWSAQQRGCWTIQTDSMTDTIETVTWFQQYTMKAKHNTLQGRPKPAGIWGKPTSRDFVLHILTSFPGVGPERAEAIIEHFGGKAPLSWRCTEAELAQVPGVGSSTARKMMEALGE